jgi:predicted O-methyltransferase YrrM
MKPVTKEYVPWQTPRQNDDRVQAIRERLAAQRGVPVTKVSKSGDVLAYLLDMTEAAELLNIQPVHQVQP